MTRRKPNKADLARISKDLRKLPIVHISKLTPDPDNANIHPTKNIESIKSSLTAFGQRENLVVNRNGHVLEAGSGRLEAALQLGWQFLAVSYEDDTPIVAKAFGVAANQTARQAIQNDTVMAETLRMINEDINIDLSDVGFNDEEYQDLINRITTKPTPEKDVSFTAREKTEDTDCMCKACMKVVKACDNNCQRYINDSG